jgi:GPH family glycoside/pentoside/hexuronide:cation symporter
LSTSTAGEERPVLAPAPPAASAARLSNWLIATYNAPTVGIGYMFFLVNIYLMAFSTDVLLVPASAMGLIFGLSRIWDAVTDPLAGYLSDRTSSRLGRRRPWLLASIIPIGAAYAMIWTPPSGLEGEALIGWMAVGVFLFYTAMTVVIVPHTSLGAELTDSYHERTRLFGARHITWNLGSLFAIAAMYLLLTTDDPRTSAAALVGVSVTVTAVLLAWAVAGVRERPEFQGKGESNPYRAFADVFRNPHARLLLAVFLIESLGGATIGILTPYVAKYIVGTPEKTPLYILMYMIPSMLSVPLWVAMSHRFGKKSLWILAMVITAVGFGSMIFVGEGDVLLISALAIFLGLGNGCGSVVSPSIQADVIDYDEYRSRQRKEGAYFAAWNFVFKTSSGLTLMLTGVVLDAAGFVPNQEQAEGTKFALRALYALFPMACYLVGALIFSRFSLDEAEHRRIRAELDARNGAGT